MSLSPALRHSQFVVGLINHIKHKHPQHNNLFELMKIQSNDPTPDQLDIASGRKELTTEYFREITKSKKAIDGNIHKMFKQIEEKKVVSYCVGTQYRILPCNRSPGIKSFSRHLLRSGWQHVTSLSLLSKNRSIKI